MVWAVTGRYKDGFAMRRERWQSCCEHGQELLLPRETSPSSSAVLDAVGVRGRILGVLGREKLQDQTFPWTHYDFGVLLAGGDEGVRSCLLLGLGLQCSSGLDASALLTKTGKNFSLL